MPCEDREPDEKESRYWRTVFNATYDRSRDAVAPPPWFQMDRGADDWQVWKAAVEVGAWVTIRSSYDRRLVVPRGEPRECLRARVADAPEAGRYTLEVQPGPGRQGRVARMVVRHVPVHLYMVERPSKRTFKPSLWAVSATEEGTTPEGESPLHWLLLTTRPVTGLEDAILVIRSYSMRWRVELFHKAWKTGTTKVEDAQLRDADAIRRWATILAAVAARVMRLSYLARHDPEAPATVELTRQEIRAVALLQRQPWDGVVVPTIAVVTGWIARLGGYTGKSSGGPPGFVVISRGWSKVQTVVDALDALDELGTWGG